MSLLLIVLVLYLSTLVHELGHALFGRLSGWQVTAFGTGVGRVKLVFPFFGMRFFVGLKKPLSGITFAFAPALLPTRWQYIVYLSGGILFNFLTALLAWGLMWALEAPGKVLPIVIWVSLFQGIGNAFPFQANLGGLRMASDGARILQIMGRGMVDESPVATIEGVRSLKPLWEGVGDELSQFVYGLAAAQSYGVLGDVNKARCEIEALGDLDAALTPTLRGFRDCVEASIFMQEGRCVEARACLDRARMLMDAGSPGAVLVNQTSVALALLDGRISEASSLLPTGGEKPSAHPTLKTAELVLEVLVAEAMGDGKAFGDALKAYEKQVFGLPPGVHSLLLYRVVMRYHGKNEDSFRAGEAARRLLAIVAHFQASFREDEQKTRFIENQKSLLASIENVLFWETRQDPGLLIEQVLSVNLPSKRRGAGNRLFFTAFALSMGAYLFQYVPEVLPLTTGFWLFLSSMLGAFAGPTLLLQLVFLFVGLFLSRAKKNLGVVSLTLAFSCWLFSAFMAFTHMAGQSF